MKTTGIFFIVLKGKNISNVPVLTTLKKSQKSSSFLSTAGM